MGVPESYVHSFCAVALYQTSTVPLKTKTCPLHIQLMTFHRISPQFHFLSFSAVITGSVTKRQHLNLKIEFNLDSWETTL